MRIIAIAFALVLSACSTVDATYEGGKGVVNGVAEDGFGITSGTFDVISNVIKDVAGKTGVEIDKKEAE